MGLYAKARADITQAESEQVWETSPARLRAKPVLIVAFEKSPPDRVDFPANCSRSDQWTPVGDGVTPRST